MTPNSFLLLAALFALVAGVSHVLLGVARVTGPLVHGTEVDPLSRWTAYIGWHMTSLTLFASAGAYAYSAARPGTAPLVAFLDLLMAVFALFEAGIATRHKLRPLLMPRWILLTLAALFGGIGLLWG
ncbi:MAG: hypothetical protein M3145_12675 [Pseudomonadota bacterium]|nr:hypothetical protein [Pseudomonadota bacterium]